MLPSCDRQLTRGYLADYLADRLTLDAKLDFLIHVENCAGCWEEVFTAAKARDAHYYRNGKRTRRRPSSKSAGGYGKEKWPYETFHASCLFSVMLGNGPVKPAFFG